MRLSIDVIPEAFADVEEIVRYIAKDSLQAAVRFTPAFYDTLDGLAEFPGKGSPKQFRPKRLVDVRSYAVDGFPNHIIYYRVEGSNLAVLAVQHGARDMERVLGMR